MEDLLTRLVELVDRAGLDEALGKLRSVRAGFARLLEEGDKRPRRHGAIEGAARLARDAQGFQRGLQLCLPETILGDFLACRQRREIQDACDDAAFDLEAAAPRNV